MKMKSIFLMFLSLLLTVTVQAQERSTRLTIQVNSVEGDRLQGQKVVLTQTDYQVSYGALTLNAEGRCQLNVYAGRHNLLVERDGFETVAHDFTVEEGITQQTVEVSLTEKTRMPYALQATVEHSAQNGSNTVFLSWNTEKPAFFDDFESYEPFAVQFGQWSGIDADNEAAAPLVGAYPNRGVMQYAQIINPLKVQPTWWYDYPILRPYDGQQYVGFTRTSSGNANDDWLISPVITVGTDNILSFMGKAADQFPERFMVYVTTKLEQPVQSDFVRLDQGNYETADYRGWKQYSYDLSAYAGKQVRLAIRYISHYNLYGSFMLMIDDFYVGQPAVQSRARRASGLRFSPANPNEQFRVFLDSQLVGITDTYEYQLDNVAGGSHTLGVQAVYIQALSDTATIEVQVPQNTFAHVGFRVTADSKLSPDGQHISLLNMATTETYQLTVADGKAELQSLPFGDYVVNVEQAAFQAYQKDITVEGDTTIDIALHDYMQTPYHITATADESGIYTLRWNQELLFSDSFEDYDDFATGKFGDWTSVDLDQQPVYPIALGNANNIVAFPGSGTANNPTAIAPMVFNPWNTTPAMLPTDPAIAAPTGDKTIIFFSPQRTKADKWLISPLLEIHEGYELSVKAKGYTSMYPESMEFCLSTGSDLPSDFTAISTVDELAAEQWALYATDLSDYVGQTIRLAVHYTSTDAFLAQVDDFTVGPEDGQGQTVDYGNVVHFDVYLDGELVGQPQQATFQLPALTDGTHVVGIRAIYQNGQSELAEYTISVTTGVTTIRLKANSAQEVYGLSGQYLGQHLHQLPAGIYLVKHEGKILKIRK